MEADGEHEQNQQSDETSGGALRRFREKFLFRRKRKDQHSPPDTSLEEEAVDPPPALSILMDLNNKMKILYGSDIAKGSIKSPPVRLAVPGLEHMATLYLETIFPPAREAGVPVRKLDSHAFIVSEDYHAESEGSPRAPFCTFINEKRDRELQEINPAVVFNRTHPIYKKFFPNSEVLAKEQPEELEKQELKLAYAILTLYHPPSSR